MNKNHLALQLEKNAIVDEGSGFIRVKGGLTLTDESIQRNGTSYDIKSLDIDDYDGKLFANHGDGWGAYTIETVIGSLVGVAKKGKRVVAEGIKYFTDNPLGQIAYKGTAQGFLTDFSVGTMGGEAEDGVFKNHTLFETSQVGMGNNKNAKLNELVANSVQEAKAQGQDTSEVEQIFSNVLEPIKQEEKKQVSYKTIKNSRKFAVKVTYKNASDEEVSTELEPGGSVDVSEDQADAVEGQITDAAEPQPETPDVSAVVNEALKPMMEKMAAMETAFDAQAKEPEFKVENGAKGPAIKKNEFEGMDYRELHQSQIETFIREGAHSPKLARLNDYNLEQLKKSKDSDGRSLVRNSMTIADMGNFVISPELLTEIQGCRTSYASVVSNTEWRETLSTQMAWLERSGDIDMQEVAFCEDTDGSVDANDNLKPISEYGATPRSSNLSEVAAVTPVCNAATRFLAVDILSDVAAGYRNDYDRKRAQLFIARLQQAVDDNGNEVAYNSGSPQDALISYLDTFGEISTCTPTGTYILSDKSLIELRKQLILAGGSDVYNSVFFRGEGGVPTIDGKPYLIVPSDLLPTLGTNETKTFGVEGESVSITEAVFYLDLSNFTGRISGGLQYDLATQAAYEDNGTVKSAFQRNEVVLRGSFFRGGAIKDSAQVAAMAAPATS